MNVFLVSGFFFLAVVGLASAQCPAGTRWQHVLSKCMMCGNRTLPADVARQQCEAEGGDLTSILTAEEHYFAEGCDPAVASATAAAGGVWIGLLVKDEDGTGTSFTYNWEDGSSYTSIANVNPLIGLTSYNHVCYYIAEALGTTAAVTYAQQATPSCETGIARYYACSRSVITCPYLVPPAGSNVTYTNSTHLYPDEVATYTCWTGYLMTRVIVNRTCQADGTWDLEAPVCDPVDCGPLHAPANGDVAVTTTTFNSVATYSCNTGYSLNDTSATRSCQANASWTDYDRTCTLVDCGSLSTPTNGSVVTSTTTYGSVAVYSCDTGLELEGATTRACMNTGFWSGAQPTCVESSTSSDSSSSSSTSSDSTSSLAVILGSSLGAVALIGTIGTVTYLCLRQPAAPRFPPPQPLQYGNPAFYPAPPRPPPGMGRPFPGRFY